MSSLSLRVGSSLEIGLLFERFVVFTRPCRPDCLWTKIRFGEGAWRSCETWHSRRSWWLHQRMGAHEIGIVIRAWQPAVATCHHHRSSHVWIQEMPKLVPPVVASHLAPNHPSHYTIVVLKPMVTWGSPILRCHQISWFWIPILHIPHQSPSFHRPDKKNPTFWSWWGGALPTTTG